MRKHEKWVLVAVFFFIAAASIHDRIPPIWALVSVIPAVLCLVMAVITEEKIR